MVLILDARALVCSARVFSVPGHGQLFKTSTLWRKSWRVKSVFHLGTRLLRKGHVCVGRQWRDLQASLRSIHFVNYAAAAIQLLKMRAANFSFSALSLDCVR